MKRIDLLGAILLSLFLSAGVQLLEDRRPAEDSSCSGDMECAEWHCTPGDSKCFEEPY